MNSNNFQMIFVKAALGIVSLAAGPMAWAQPWTSFDNNTRYLALGDSLSAGYEAKPVTQGFVYQLYQGGVIDNLNNLLFCTEAVPNATSTDVLHYQIPQVHLFFTDTGTSYRKVVTLTVGGNDLLSLLGPGGTIDLSLVPGALATYGNNLFWHSELSCHELPRRAGLRGEYLRSKTSYHRSGSAGSGSESGYVDGYRLFP